MMRGATRQHARLKAVVLIERYLRGLEVNRGPAARTPDDDRPSTLPRAA